MRRFTGKRLILPALFGVLAAIAAAQDKAAEKPVIAATSAASGVRGKFLDEVAYYEHRFTRLAEAIPADKYQGLRSGQIAEVAGEQAVHGTRSIHFYHRALWRASGPIDCVCAANRDRSALDGRKNEAGSGEAEAVIQLKM